MNIKLDKIKNKKIKDFFFRRFDKTYESPYEDDMFKDFAIVFEDDTVLHFGPAEGRISIFFDERRSVARR